MIKPYNFFVEMQRGPGKGNRYASHLEIALSVAIDDGEVRGARQRVFAPRQSDESEATGNDSKIRLTPFVLWHLLSMDAPTVALCWMIFTASVTGTRLPLASGAAMWLAVWILYAADRLMDTRHLLAKAEDHAGELEVRHLFHHRYRAAFRVGIVVSVICLAGLLPMLPVASLRLYSIEGVLMAGYFVLVHSRRGLRGTRFAPYSRRSSMPKELLVGPFFAAAVFIPTISRRPELRWELLPPAVLFAGLCSLNCLSIFAWEHPADGATPFGTGWAVRRLETLVWLFVLLSLIAFFSTASHGFWPMSFRLFGLACAGGGVALAVCDRLGDRLSRTTLRVAADLCLLTPLLIFPFLRY